MHTWIHIYIYIHTYHMHSSSMKYIYIYIHTYHMHSSSMKYMYIYIYTYISHAFQLYEIHVYIYIHIHITCIPALWNTCIYIYIHIHITCIPALWNTCIYIYTYISHAFQLYEIHIYIYPAILRNPARRSVCFFPAADGPQDHRRPESLFSSSLSSCWRKHPLFFFGGYHVNSWRPTGFKYVWAPFLRHCFKSLQIAPNRLWSMTYLA